MWPTFNRWLPPYREQYDRCDCGDDETTGERIECRGCIEFAAAHDKWHATKAEIDERDIDRADALADQMKDDNP